MTEFRFRDSDEEGFFICTIPMNLIAGGHNFFYFFFFAKSMSLQKDDTERVIGLQN